MQANRANAKSRQNIKFLSPLTFEREYENKLVDSFVVEVPFT